MVIVKTKETTREDDPIDTKIELLKFTTDVQGRISDNRDVTSDFVLSILGEKDKEMTIEMTQNAMLIKKLILIYSKTKQWEWDKIKNEWVEKELKKDEKKLIEDTADRTFDTLMTRIQMIQVVNRNKPKNPILRILGGQSDPTDEDEQMEKMEELKVKLKEATKIRTEENK